MKEFVHASEYMNFRLQSEEMSAKIYLDSISEAKKVFNEIIKLGTSKNVFSYIYNYDDTYRKVILNSTNQKEWDKFMPDVPELGRSSALMGDMKFNNNKIALELFNDVGTFSNVFDTTKPTVYVRYIDEKKCADFHHKTLKTLDIPNEIKEIVIKHNGELIDDKGKVISFDE